MTFGIEKRAWCNYPTVRKVEDMFTRLDRIHKRDGQIDGQTDTA